MNLSTRKKAVLLKDYCKRYLETLEHARENTRKSRERSVNIAIKYLGDFRLSELTNSNVEKYFVQKRLDDGLDPVTINHDIAFLKILLNKAVTDGLLGLNPLKLKPLKVEKSRDRVLNKEEIDLIFKELKGKDRAMVITSLLTGMRLSEVLTLKWSDIDFEQGLITVKQQKTGKIITIPLASTLANELLLYKASGDILFNGRVFEASDINSTVIKNYSFLFSRLFNRIGIKGFTFHGLRHTFASLNCQLGMDVVSVQSLLGHSDLSMTSRYSHSQLDTKRRGISTLDNFISLQCTTGVRHGKQGSTATI